MLTSLLLFCHVSPCRWLFSWFNFNLTDFRCLFHKCLLFWKCLFHVCLKCLFSPSENMKNSLTYSKGSDHNSVISWFYQNDFNLLWQLPFVNNSNKNKTCTGLCVCQSTTRPPVWTHPRGYPGAGATRVRAEGPGSSLVLLPLCATCFLYLEAGRFLLHT